MKKATANLETKCKKRPKSEKDAGGAGGAGAGAASSSGKGSTKAASAGTLGRRGRRRRQEQTYTGDEVAMGSEEDPSGTGNSPCWICNDSGMSSISNPNVVLPLPSQLVQIVGSDTSTCADLARFAEDDRLIPDDLCSIMDAQQLRDTCGCPNAMAPAATPVVQPPTAAGVGTVSSGGTGVATSSSGKGSSKTSAAGGAGAATSSSGKGSSKKANGAAGGAGTAGVCPFVTKTSWEEQREEEEDLEGRARARVVAKARQEVVAMLQRQQVADRPFQALPREAVLLFRRRLARCQLLQQRVPRLELDRLLQALRLAVTDLQFQALQVVAVHLLHRRRMEQHQLGGCPRSPLPM